MKKKTQSSKLKPDKRPVYKLQVDKSTFVTVRSMHAVNSWKAKYPNAKLIDE